LPFALNRGGHSRPVFFTASKIYDSIVALIAVQHVNGGVI